MWRTPEGRQAISGARDWYRTVKLNCVCEKCGKTSSKEDKDFSFHHKPETVKINDISRMAKNGYTIEELKAEMAKCVCLCRKCYKEWKD